MTNTANHLKGTNGKISVNQAEGEDGMAAVEYHHPEEVVTVSLTEAAPVEGEEEVKELLSDFRI